MSTEATVHRRRFPDLGDVARNFGAVFADPKAIFGIKLGLAGILALYLSRLIRLKHANWALFTVLVLATATKNFVGGKADRGSLQAAFQVSVGGLLFLILVFLISPALSNYSVMNLFLFAQLFAYGYYSASLGGQTLHQI